HTTVRGAAGRVRTLVAVVIRSFLPDPGWSVGHVERDTVGVEHVDIRLRRVIRMYGETEHPPVPEIVGHRSHVGDDAHRTARVGRRLYDASLLGDEHATVACELEVGRVDQVVGSRAGPVEVLPLEALRDCTGRGSETE